MRINLSPFAFQYWHLIIIRWIDCFYNLHCIAIDDPIGKLSLSYLVFISNVSNITPLSHIFKQPGKVLAEPQSSWLPGPGSRLQVDQRAAPGRQRAVNSTWDRDRGHLLSTDLVINKLRWITNFLSEWISSSLPHVELKSKQKNLPKVELQSKQKNIQI